MVGCWHQYALHHIGSGIINKQLGITIEGKWALECNEDSLQWEKAHGVVALCRTHRVEVTVIVGHVKFAVNIL
jgi:hypothetical protein